MTLRNKAHNIEWYAIMILKTSAVTIFKMEIKIVILEKNQNRVEIRNFA